MQPLFLLFIAIFFISNSVSAQSNGAFIDIPDENVLEITQKMRPLLYKFKISDTEYLGKETKEELADPLLTLEEAETVIVRGIISATAEWCKLDWKNKSFEPFMNSQRSSGKTEKQMAYIGGLHGYGMGIMSKTYAEKKCNNSAIINRVKGFLY